MTAFSTLDWLLMPNNDQTILGCLTRKPRQTLSALAHATRLPPADIEEGLARLLKASSVVMDSEEGRAVFSVRLSNSQTTIRHSPLSALDIFP